MRAGLYRAKKKKEVFIINMTVLFYFPRGFSKAYCKMYRWNRDGNHLKRVKGLSLIKRVVNLNLTSFGGKCVFASPLQRIYGQKLKYGARYK